MKNFGFRKLALVQPHVKIDEKAHARAWNAEDILERAESHADLPSAIADQQWVCAATRRLSRRRGGPVPFDEVDAQWLAYAQSAPAALVFGPEDAGLSNEELLPCQRWVTIPTSPRQPSLNLSHAVAVLMSKLALATVTREVAPAGQRASVEQFEEMIDQWFSVLGEVGFLNPQNPRHIMWDLRSILLRAGVDERETAILRGIAANFKRAIRERQ